MARVLIIGSLEAELGQAARIAVARGARLTVAEGAAAGHGTSTASTTARPER